MFIVAPSGSTNPLVCLETPNLFSHVSILMGSVTMLDAVVKAMICGRSISRINVRTETRDSEPTSNG